MIAAAGRGEQKLQEELAAVLAAYAEPGREGLLPEVAARRLSVTELRAGIGHFAALAGLFPALAA